MKDFRNISLLTTDHRPAVRALTTATGLARSLGGRLTFADWRPDGHAVADFLQADRLRELRRLALAYAPEMEIRFRLLGGPLEAALEHLGASHDLLIPATDDPRIAHEILRVFPAPVWLPGHRTVPARQVLAAVDSDATDPLKRQLNRRIVQTSTSLAELLGAELELFSVWTPPGPAGRFAGRLAGRDALRRQAELTRGRLRSLLAETLGQAPAGGGPRLHVAGGNPTELIAEAAAARSADLIVAGHTGRVGLPGWLLGNTAEKLARRVNCSLLAVKPPADTDAPARAA